MLRKKTIEQSIADTDEPEYQLKKRLTALDLTVFGIGVIIGAGIFTLTGRAAKAYAGPGIALSFVLAAVCCALAALCYAEFSSTVPVSGSAYTFSYFSLGEIFAWIIGWDLLLELMLGASVVAQGWSTYAALFLEQIGLGWPASIGPDSNVNVLAMLLVAVLATLATIGIKESLRVNLVLVAIKLFVVLFVIIAGLFYIKGSNLSPFIPPSVPAPNGDVTITTPLFQALFGFTPSTFGVMGLVSGASLVFFAFIGFDVVATTAEEAKNPQRDLPRGIIGSLAICTVLYVLVCIVITGMVKYTDINGEAALAEAFRSVGRRRLRDADLRGCRGRSDHGGADADDRRRPGGVRDEPRPPDAASARQDAPEVGYAVPPDHRRSASSSRSWPVSPRSGSWRRW